MKKIASGDGWFDLQMSAEERASLLHGMTFALKNYDALDQIEIGPSEFTKEGISALVEKSKPAKDGFVTRFSMREYMTVSMTLWSMLATIRANQIDAAQLDKTLDVEKLKSARQALSDALPDSDVTPDLYPKSDRPDLPQAIKERGNGKKSP